MTIEFHNYLPCFVLSGVDLRVRVYVYLEIYFYISQYEADEFVNVSGSGADARR